MYFPLPKAGVPFSFSFCIGVPNVGLFPSFVQVSTAEIVAAVRVNHRGTHAALVVMTAVIQPLGAGCQARFSPTTPQIQQTISALTAFFQPATGTATGPTTSLRVVSQIIFHRLLDSAEFVERWAEVICWRETSKKLKLRTQVFLVEDELCRVCSWILQHRFFIAWRPHRLAERHGHSMDVDSI